MANLMISVLNQPATSLSRSLEKRTTRESRAQSALLVDENAGWKVPRRTNVWPILTDTNRRATLRWSSFSPGCLGNLPLTAATARNGPVQRPADALLGLLTRVTAGADCPPTLFRQLW